uniref:Uncharacterized protein n=1 Tax=Globodera rostochiensis TaxID=31243 RepID=A0A914HUG3_GLORO
MNETQLENCKMKLSTLVGEEELVTLEDLFPEVLQIGEVRILRDIRHENIVGVLDMFTAFLGAELAPVPSEEHTVRCDGGHRELCSFVVECQFG